MKWLPWILLILLLVSLPASAVTTRLNSAQIATNATNIYILQTDGTNSDWVDPETVSTKPAGANTHVQYNNNGSFGGDAGFVFIVGTGDLAVSNDITAGADVHVGTAINPGIIVIADGDGNYVTIDVPALIGADWTLTLPADDGDNLEVLQTDGSGNTSWVAALGAAHAILDGLTHNDSVADAVTRGSIIIGNATPKWDELPIGVAGELLTSDGTDAAWAAPDGNLTIDSVPDADNTAEGILSSLTAGENIAFPQVCFQNADGEIHLADANQAGEYPAFVMALETKVDGQACSVLMNGYVRDDGWNWTVGAVIYLSETPGGLTETAPSDDGDIIQVLGVATHADRIWFFPNLMLIEHS